MAPESNADTYGDIPLHQLDENVHQEELRQRYYGLLQELRVLLPGVQVLVAFLLTAPFAFRFQELDPLGRISYGVALWAGMMATIAFVTPTVFHRIGGRHLRAERLMWGIRSTRAGLAFLAVALLAAALLVARFVFEPFVAWVFVGSLACGMLGFWVLVPILSSRRHDPTWRR
jgi:hypothetical protein